MSLQSLKPTSYGTREECKNFKFEFIQEMSLSTIGVQIPLDLIYPSLEKSHFSPIYSAKRKINAQPFGWAKHARSSVIFAAAETPYPLRNGAGSWKSRLDKAVDTWLSDVKLKSQAKRVAAVNEMDDMNGKRIMLDFIGSRLCSYIKVCGIDDWM